MNPKRTTHLSDLITECHHLFRQDVTRCAVEKLICSFLRSSDLFHQIYNAVGAIPIQGSQEKLCAIPKSFPRFEPHAYQSIGAPYGSFSPYSLRQSVITRLCQAQQTLNSLKPGYQLKIFDGYRPLSVQSYMVDHTLKIVTKKRGYLNPITDDQKKSAMREVLKVWAIPNNDPLAPPPHSTGAAIDLTIIDSEGKQLEMGCPIDHMGVEAESNYYTEKTGRFERIVNKNRHLLADSMESAGFHRLPHEWWHFSYGDQWWSFLRSMRTRSYPPHSEKAIYERI